MKPAKIIAISFILGIVIGVGGCALLAAHSARAALSGSTVSFNGDRITNIADPVANGDAATKNYFTAVLQSRL